MSEYEVGQRVRMEWPDGSAVEGTVCMPNRGIPDRLYVCIDGAYFRLNDRKRITVLSEPPVDEPTGLGAVVEAGQASTKWNRIGRVLWVKIEGGWWVNRTNNLTVRWALLSDPVVKHEGWVQ